MKNKDYFIRKTAEDLHIQEKLVDKIISSSYKDLIRVLSHTDTTSIEIGGLGKLRLNISKAQKKIDELYYKKERLEQKLNLHRSNIHILSSEEFHAADKTYKETLRNIKNIELKYNKATHQLKQQ